LSIQIFLIELSTYIKEIILENFLSHRYSRIPLNKGVNLITGPNGSGKSSILLGISVALGQTYTERSRKLSDLIYFGEEIARVTLMMDNTPKEGKRPFPSSSLNQVMITRIIRKDGTYWFEFNQEVIEKYQLQRMLKKLGVNPDNEMIIMHQHMIEEFIAKDPIERLKLFEEALGIGEYRKHVLNSLSKLEEIEKGAKSIYQSLQNAEVNLKYWKNLYQKYERKVKLIEQISRLKNELLWAKYNEIKNKLDKIKSEIDLKTNEKIKIESYVNELKDKIKDFLNYLKNKLKSNFIIDELLSDIEKYSDFKSNLAISLFKIKLLEEEIGSKLPILKELEEEFVKIEKKKKGEYVETKRSSQEIEEELRDLQAELKTLEDINEEVVLRYKEYLQIFEDTKNKSKEIEENKEKTKQELKSRTEAWKKIITESVSKVNEIFQDILSKVDGIGYLSLSNLEDINKCSLDISVGFKGTSPVALSSYLQSGGEKTVAVMAFLLACQQYMKSSIRAVDEFDVHMDPLNKERISILLSSLPKDNPEVQYIFITPDPMIKYFKDSNIIIVTKQEGSSNISKVIQD